LKLKVSCKQQSVIYPMSNWRYEPVKRQLIQTIPIVEEVRFNIAGTSKEFATFQIPKHGYVATFHVGDSLYLDDKKMYVVNIEPVIPDGHDVVFVYYLGNAMPVSPEFWETEVEVA